MCGRYHLPAPYAQLLTSPRLAWVNAEWRAVLTEAFDQPRGPADDRVAGPRIDPGSLSALTGWGSGPTFMSSTVTWPSAI